MYENQSETAHALARVGNYMDIKQRKLIMNTFILSQFGYCSLVWMFHNRTLNNRINKIHERALRIAYNDYVSNFEEHLASDNSVNIHKRNLQVSATEMYKVLPTLSPSLIRELFTKKK